MTYDEWKELGNKRAEITSALQALGIPIVGWMNEVPTFPAKYKPDWVEIKKIATAVNTKAAAPKKASPKKVTKPKKG